MPIGDTATIQYQVTNQSKKTHTLKMTPVTGIDSSGCTSPLGYQQSCILTLTVHSNGLQGDVSGGPVLCEQGNPLQCYQPSSANIMNIKLASTPGMTTLTSSVSTIALSVTALGGKPRLITITNTGSNAATNVVYSVSGLPGDATVTPASCGTIAPSVACILTITPGATASATPGSTSPTPISFSIHGDNTNTLTPTANILAYGSVYQSGYLFSADDSPANNVSIAGKVAALVDQSTSITWSSDGTLGTADNFDIPGIYETSTTPCLGAQDGACDTGVIVAYYNTHRSTGGSAPTPLTFYASGLCKATIDGYSDWYLPAVCELGYDGLSQGSTCGTSLAPTLQNIQSNLINNSFGGFSGNYWASTELSSTPSIDVWLESVSAGSNVHTSKDKFLSVRCVRALT